MEAQLSDPATYSDKDKFKQTEMSYQKLSNELAQLNTEYEAAFEKVMEMESKMG
jgi:ATP-binding cassette subfamily F protein 3